MKGAFVAGVLAVGAFGAGREAAPAGIAIRVYNYAAITGEDLLRAKEEARRVFRHAGIDIDFTDCPLTPADRERFPGCEPGRRPVEFVLRVQPGYLPPDLGGSSVSGFALLDGQGFGIYASVFTGNTEILAQGSRRVAVVMLGCLMAHEIGHLLLRTSRHSVAGVMSARWGQMEALRAAQGGLWFTRQEARQIQANWRAYAGRAARDRLETAWDGAVR